MSTDGAIATVYSDAYTPEPTPLVRFLRVLRISGISIDRALFAEGKWVPPPLAPEMETAAFVECLVEGSFETRRFLASLARNFIAGTPIDPGAFECCSPAWLAAEHFYRLLDPDPWGRHSAALRIPAGASVYRDAIEHRRRLAVAEQVLAATENDPPGPKVDPTHRLARDLMIVLTRWAKESGMPVTCPGNDQPDGYHTNFSKLVETCITEAEAAFLTAARAAGLGNPEMMRVKGALGDLHGSSLFRRLRPVVRAFG